MNSNKNYGVRGEYINGNITEMTGLTLSAAESLYNEHVSKGHCTVVSVYEDTSAGRVPCFGWIKPEHVYGSENARAALGRTI